MSNGCGCEKGLFRFVKPPYAGKFRAACEIHDFHYARADISRRQADVRLFRDMVKIVEKTESTPFRVWWFANIAMVYYVAVRTFGWLYYNKR